MQPIKSFIATIQSNDSGGAYVENPFDVEAAFGSKREDTCHRRITKAITLLRDSTITPR